MSESTSVVNWQEQMANEARAVAKLERPQLAQISTRSGIMSYMNQPIPGNVLECVVVSSIMENNLFTEAFDANSPRNPDCFSFSTTGIDMLPHEVVVDKRSETCKLCPNMAWGSSPTGSGKGKACKSIRKLAVIPIGALKEGAVGKAEVAVLRVPVTSVKHWSSYVNEIASVHARPSWGMITKISIKPHMTNQFEILFEAMGPIGESLLPELHQKAMKALEQLMQPYEPNPEETVEQKEAKEAAAAKRGKRKY